MGLKRKLSHSQSLQLQKASELKMDLISIFQKDLMICLELDKKASKYPVALWFHARQAGTCLKEICGYGFHLMEWTPIRFIEIPHSF